MKVAVVVVMRIAVKGRKEVEKDSDWKSSNEEGKRRGRTGRGRREMKRDCEDEDGEENYKEPW